MSIVRLQEKLTFYLGLVTVVHATGKRYARDTRWAGAAVHDDPDNYCDDRS